MADLRELQQRLAAVKKAVRAEAMAALRDGAEEIASAMRRAVPADTGKLRGTIRVEQNADLSVSIKVGGPVTTKKVRMSRRRSSSRNSPEVDYATFVEFGTKKRKAQPFFWPTWRLTKRATRAKVERRIKKALESVGGGG